MAQGELWAQGALLARRSGQCNDRGGAPTRCGSTRSVADGPRRTRCAAVTLRYLLYAALASRLSLPPLPQSQVPGPLQYHSSMLRLPLRLRMLSMPGAVAYHQMRPAGRTAASRRCLRCFKLENIPAAASATGSCCSGRLGSGCQYWHGARWWMLMLQVSESGTRTTSQLVEAG